eukprot:jgi/Mesvir1/344/Mv22748-RA.1
MDDQYVTEGEDPSQAQKDIDDFEARLAGKASAGRSAPARPAANAGAKVEHERKRPNSGNKAVPQHVPPSRITEKEQEEADAREAMDELDKFDQKLGGARD